MKRENQKDDDKKYDSRCSTPPPLEREKFDSENTHLQDFAQFCWAKLEKTRFVCFFYK